MYSMYIIDKIQRNMSTYLIISISRTVPVILYPLHEEYVLQKQHDHNYKHCRQRSAVKQNNDNCQIKSF